MAEKLSALEKKPHFGKRFKPKQAGPKKSNRVFWFVTIFLLINFGIILTTMLTVAAIPSISPEGKNIVAWSGEAWSVAGRYLIEQIYLNNFFKQPALVVGFLTLIGYLIMNRGWKDSVLGALKTIIGFILLQIGSGIITGLSIPVFKQFQNLSGSTVVPLDPYLGWSSANNFLKFFSTTQSYLSLVTYTFILAFSVNIILVALKRWTNVHSLMVTGHVMFQQTSIITTGFYILLFREIPLIGANANEISAAAQVGLVIITALFLGTYWGVGSTATYKPTNVVTENAGFAIGHQQMLGIVLTSKIGRFFGNKENNIEHKKMPKWLKIFEDNIFVQSLIISLLFLILILIIVISKPDIYLDGNKFAGELSIWNDTFPGAHWIINIFAGSFKIVAALIAMITGVRMFVTELQQSFQGVSEKLIPGAVVAIDIAAVYGFAPNAVTFAFVSGTIGQFIGMGIVIAISAVTSGVVTIVIPLFITLFFSSGAIGPYANAAGGSRATLLIPAILGVIEILIISFGLKGVDIASKEIINPNAAPTWPRNPFESGYIGMMDWNLIFGFILLVSSYVAILGYIFVPIVFVLLVLYGIMLNSGIEGKQNALQRKLHKIKKQT